MLESWALEPADSSLVEECRTPRRGEGPGGRGEGVGLLVGGALRGILGAQQYPLSPTLSIKAQGMVRVHAGSPGKDATL